MVQNPGQTFCKLILCSFSTTRGWKLRVAWSASLFLKKIMKDTQSNPWLNFLPFGSTGSIPGLNQGPAVMEMEISGDQSNLLVGTFPVNSNGLELI